MTKVYKVNIKNDVEFKKFIEKQGYKYLSNSVLKNCFAGDNYYWLDDWNNVKYYGLLLDTLINQKDIVTNEPVYNIVNFVSTLEQIIYEYMAENADRRSKEYKILDKHLDVLCDKYGKESKEVNDFLNHKVGDVIDILKTIY